MSQAAILFLALVAAPALWLAPGFFAARLLRAPWPLLCGALGSASLGLVFLVAGEAAGLAWAGRGGLALWCALTLALGLAARRAPRVPLERPAIPSGAERLFALAALIALLGLALRAAIDPLSGWDQSFRWDWLARQLVAEGRLSFYPPVSALDFERYGFPDGIPPLASLANAWVYLVAGECAAPLTWSRIVGEGVFTGLACAALARALWGPGATWPALGLVGSSALVGWGLGIGQETGLLGVALASGCALLVRSIRADEPAAAAWAGLAFGLAAWCREYALVLGPLAAVGAFLQGRRREALLCVGVFAACAGPWYLRNTALTGDPLFPQGLLDGEKSGAYAALLASVRATWGRPPPGFDLSWFAATLPCVAGLPLVAALAGLFGAKAREARWAGLLAAAVGGLWVWSVGYTSGGWNYSLRVLAPGVVLAAAIGARTCVAPVPSRWRAMLALVTVLAAADAARRSWWLPALPRASPLAPWAGTWRSVTVDGSAPSRVAEGVRLALPDGAQGRVAVENAALQNALNAAGLRATSFYAPDLAPAFDSSITPETAAGRVLACGVRWVGWAPGDLIAGGIATRSPLLSRLVARHPPAVVVEDLAVWDLSALAPPSVAAMNAP